MTEQSPSPHAPATVTERLSPRQAFARAVVFQREGQVAEADKLYQGILRLDPNHVDPDLLDQQIRTNLNLVAPNEIIIMQANPAAPIPPMH